ncbi:MAG: hypothetical protein ACRBF0_07835 [Calditrichia bacterium]
MNGATLKFCLFLTVLLAFGGTPRLFAQDNPIPRAFLTIAPDTLNIANPSAGDTLQLPHRFVIPQTENLKLRAFRLSKNLHYRIDYRSGEIILLARMPKADTLTIVYKHYPFSLPSDVFNRELQPLPPDSLSDSTVVASEARSRILDELDSYQNNLSKSGSIVRGIEIGSNQDLTLNSGLNLQLSGNITPDVELIAALTDESTPIQPEGNTQTLREVDKVFVKIKSPFVGGTLGDFNLQYKQSVFGNVQRKLQGVTIDNQIKNYNQQFTFGTSRGLFNSNRFLAQEGNQGPYQLTGRNGERDIIVLAGTEKVFVDGVAQQRGENNDYIIDYGLGQITFTNKRLVTSENRVEVDFEYTIITQRYGRNFTGISSKAQYLNGKLGYDIRMFREWDDTNNLLEDDTELTNEERDALSNAGDNPFRASVSGVDSVGENRGSYSKSIDPITNTTIFIFAGRGNGDFSIVFTNVGDGNGSYRRGPALGEFIYVGPEQADYSPIRLVPLAGDRRLATLAVQANPNPGVALVGEFAVSQSDQNVFSSIADSDNDGGALQLTSTLRDTAFVIGGADLGKVQLTTRWTRQDSSFNPLDRPLQPEYAYKWNLNSASLSNEESSLETTLAYEPVSFLRLQGSIGLLDKAAAISSDRRVGQVELLETIRPGVNLLYRYETVGSETALNTTDWLRQKFSAKKSYKRFGARLEFNTEDRQVDDTNTLSGFSFDEALIGLTATSIAGVDLGVSAQQRKDKLYNPLTRNEQLDQATTTTYEFNGTLGKESPLQGRFAFAFRDKNFTSFFENLSSDSLEFYQADAQFQDTSWQDRQSHLANIELQYRNKESSLTSRLDYQVASELQSTREQVYVFIGNNLGNFRFDSTLTEYVPDPLGDYLLVLRQTGEFESIIRLEAGWQLQYRPKPITTISSKLRKTLNKLSGNSYIKVEEQSRENDIWDIYLLNLSKFHSPASSLRGVYLLNQDLYYNERNPDWGILLRSRYRDNLSNQFLQTSNNETRIIWERLVQMRKRFFKRKLNITGEYKNNFNKRFVSSTPTRNRNILSQSIVGRFNFRPVVSWQFQLDVERGLERDRNSNSLLEVNVWDIRPQISWSLRGKARATANTTLIQVQEVANPFALPIPFELGKGKKIGNSWLWNLRFEYFISANVTINANYTGRDDAGALRTIHLGKAEVRAFF